ncbi:Rok-like winged helix domain-containing protein [Lederbergia lenta]|uniref:Rok-like winged helix domain-containing protein n=1 Tax=Lederbergia lenta TaxID=1467 RepID=UPI00203AAA96|nr:competence protein ComK [Lederbergia lenta]MCM3109428.1 competence protein ComK [Lederbergia lenta]
MFTERMALKMRLEQMIDTEERLMRELQKERAFIFSRLREIDTKDQPVEEEVSSELHYLESTAPFIESEIKSENIHQTSKPSKNKKNRPSRRSKTTKMRESAITILKERTTPIRGAELKRLIEERTDFKIANMTTFMHTIEKHDENISKIGRGLYTYQTKRANEVILIGNGDVE